VVNAHQRPSDEVNHDNSDTIRIVLVFGFSTAISLAIGREFIVRDVLETNFTLGHASMGVIVFHIFALFPKALPLLNCSGQFLEA